MNLLLKLGGRKFLLAMLTIAAAIYLEMTGHPLSPTMAGFLASIVGLFAAANTAATKNHLQAKPDSSNQKLDDLRNIIERAFNPEDTQNLIQLLSGLSENVNQTRNAVAQVHQAVVKC